MPVLPLLDAIGKLQSHEIMGLRASGYFACTGEPVMTQKAHESCSTDAIAREQAYLWMSLHRRTLCEALGMLF